MSVDIPWTNVQGMVSIPTFFPPLGLHSEHGDEWSLSERTLAYAFGEYNWLYTASLRTKCLHDKEILALLSYQNCAANDVQTNDVSIAEMPASIAPMQHEADKRKIRHWKGATILIGLAALSSYVYLEPYPLSTLAARWNSNAELDQKMPPSSSLSYAMRETPGTIATRTIIQTVAAQLPTPLPVSSKQGDVAQDSQLPLGLISEASEYPESPLKATRSRYNIETLAITKPKHRPIKKSVKYGKPLQPVQPLALGLTEEIERRDEILDPVIWNDKSTRPTHVPTLQMSSTVAGSTTQQHENGAPQSGMNPTNQVDWTQNLTQRRILDVPNQFNR